MRGYRNLEIRPQALNILKLSLLSFASVVGISNTLTANVRPSQYITIVYNDIRKVVTRLTPAIFRDTTPKAQSAQKTPRYSLTQSRGNNGPSPEEKLRYVFAKSIFLNLDNPPF